jgi:hypothetical protein
MYQAGLGMRDGHAGRRDAKDRGRCLCVRRPTPGRGSYAIEGLLLGQQPGRAFFIGYLPRVSDRARSGELTPCIRPRRTVPESYIDSGYEQHCLGTPNSGRSYARRTNASRTCPRSWMSPSFGSILGEQGQQPADQCRLYARQHRTGP